ncbi:MAG TPA: beta-ketoacyl synthase N-terminal-like domain-containing protein [Spirochaetota bacterium]|nr:beta-ketoacyl synthase N-terminal-like domain-containing protein [Spirochaetota bacterium]
MKRNRVFIRDFTSISSLGVGINETISNLEKEQCPIYIPTDSEIFHYPHFRINQTLFDSNELINCSKIVLKLLEMVEKSFVKYKNIPIFIGTSTGGIRETEEVYRDLSEKKIKYPLFKRHFFNKMVTDVKSKYGDTIGEFYTFSTACSSSGHSLLQAYKFIKNGLIDRALVVGVDTLSLTTMIGFDSLKLVSHTGTKPLTTGRDGLSLGEGGGVLFLESGDETGVDSEIVGCHSNSDGYHISSPDPDGAMQRECVEKTLQEAGITPSDIDYINAHGTGTPMNDEVEIKTIKTFFNNKVIVSSLKSFIGHTLGASTACELAITLAMLKNNKIYQVKDFSDPMDEIVLTKTIQKDVKYFLKNSFGFGGNNFTVGIKVK